MLRVVFDSNIFVSALAFPGGAADRALAHALQGRITLLLSEPLLGEVLGVMGRKFLRDTEELSRLAVFLTELAEPIDPRLQIAALSDEPDNRVLECAVAGRADLIVTGDSAMQRLGKFEGVSIIKLRELLHRLERDDRD